VSAPGNAWFTFRSLQDTIQFLLSHLFVVNGEGVRRQERVVPMGLECSPQLANLYAYAVQSSWVERAAPSNVLTWRFIDDIIVIGPETLTPGRGIPSQETTGWGTSTSPSTRTTSSTSG